ncbi:uncharacterized protein LOC114363186 [Ostrinia furnacalis]|uniref:uncharacterized protein LOC114363186 n=1 Tax=Ostrinia furnacalis TaxID=93504 RepID=UPI00103E57D6|nr:uncharacterized protein LOC114363186 [Ostrinia furnacalis]
MNPQDGPAPIYAAPNTPAPSLAAPPAQASTETETLASISVSSRIPDFWSDQPRLWFVQFEAVVESQRLGDVTKQNLVVTKLSKSAIQQVSDLLLSPPQERRYQTLKDRLLQVFEESETRQFQKLLGEMELGTQKPSQLLRRMRDLARNKLPDSTLQIMWTRHLPSAVQAVLAVTEVKDLESLATVADKVMEATRPEYTEIAEMKTSTPGSIHELSEMINRLQVEVAELRRSRTPQRQECSTARGRTSRSGQRDVSMSRKKPNWLCFYHHRYRAKAVKCVEPCNWKGAKPTSTQGN